MTDRAPTLSELRETYTQQKRQADPLWTRVVLRPLSFLTAWIFFRLNVTANQTTVLAIFCTVLGGTLMATGVGELMLAGAFAFNLFALFDCVDGTIARYHNRADEFGAWLDALGGYVTYTTILLTVPFGLARVETLVLGLSGAELTMLGGIAASANLLIRLEYQGIATDDKDSDIGKPSLPDQISKNLGITGALPPLIVVAILTDLLPWLFVTYAAFYIVSLLVMTVAFARRGW